MWPKSCARWAACALLGVASASASQVRLGGGGVVAHGTVGGSPQEATKSKPTRVVRTGELEGVTCEVTYDWPDALSRGTFPLRIRLTNDNTRSLIVSLEVKPSWAVDDITRRRLALERGAVAEFELLLRARTNRLNQYFLTLEAGGEDVLIGPLGPSDFMGPGTRSVMVVSARAPAAGTEESRTAAWNELVRTGKSRLGTDVLSSSARTFGQLSTSWQAYTSLDSVILDLSSGQPGPDQFAALASWCRAGGKLIVSGLSLESLAELDPFASQIEPRFERQPEDPEAFEEAGLVALKFGFGTLIAERAPFSPGSGLNAPGAGQKPLALIADQAKFLAAWNRPGLSSSSRQAWVQGTLDAFDDLPLRSLMGLLLLFALVMGPANFLWIKKMKKPMLLLVSVPGIALVTSITLLLYGVLSQGLDIKSITKTWSILDQRTQVASTSEVREVFAGSAPGAGLRPQAGTAVVPEERFWKGSFRRKHLFSSDLTDGTLLGGDYFPVRQPFSQMILSDRATRLRLEVHESPGGLEVSNLLGAGIVRLLLRASNGEYHYLAGELEQGAGALLKPGGRSARLSEWRADLNWIWGEGSSGALLPGTYIAQLTSAPLGDDCGVEVNEISGRHVLLGILDVAQGALK